MAVPGDLQSKEGSGVCLLQRLFLLAWVWVWAFLSTAGSVSGAPGGSAAERWRALLAETSNETTLDARLLRVIALVNLGEVERGLREFDAMAQADFEPFAVAVIERSTRAAEAAPDDLVVLNSLAFAHHALAMSRNQREEFDEAIRWYRRILEVDPGNVWIRHYLALAYYNLEQVGQAVAVLQEALTYDRRNQYTHLLLGLAYSEQKAYAKAALHLLQAPEALRTYRSLQDLGK